MKHNFERIVGAKTKESEAEAHRKLAELHDRDLPDELMEASVEITVEHQKIVQGIIAYAQKLLDSLGIKKPTPQLKFVLYDREKALQNNAISEPAYGFFKNGLAVIGVANTGDLTVFADTFAHEYFHSLGLQSARAVQDSEEETVVRSYRNGLSLFSGKDGDTRYFRDLEEALVTELAARTLQDAPEASIGSLDQQDIFEHMNTLRTWFNESQELRQAFGETEYQKKLSTINEIINIPDVEQLVPVLESNTLSDVEKFSQIKAFTEQRLDHIKMRSYKKEREKLKIVINDITIAEPTLTKEEVFIEFARAHFSGNYMPLARLVEKTYGKGGFRALAEETKA